VVSVTEPVLLGLAAGRAKRYGGVKQLANVGVHDEAVIDLIASDAIAAGFTRMVLVVNPDTGPAIEAHVKEHWPKSLSVAFAIQSRPLGTVHAVLAARHDIDPEAPFAVANADDLYGREALSALMEHLRTQSTNALVGFRLDRALVGETPVTRGVCTVEGTRLTHVDERRKVHRSGDRFRSDDGREPVELHGAVRVSMNLWGFRPSMWQLFDTAMLAATSASEDQEVLLPEVVGSAVEHDNLEITVLFCDARCIGVTHAEDLAVVQADVRAQVMAGERPDRPFGD
jgi:CTP:molybdopterin cytidylyltransferase MocA